MRNTFRDLSVDPAVWLTFVQWKKMSSSHFFCRKFFECELGLKRLSGRTIAAMMAGEKILRLNKKFLQGIVSIL